MKIHFLKTVWSDMIILEEGIHFALVDTGMEDQYEQLSGYLDSIGVQTIDFILLTHFHRDHYGNVCNLIRNYRVDTVYYREYGGHDRTTAWGSQADEDYRQSERDKWESIRRSISENSSLVMVETIQSIDFAETSLHLYANENYVQKIWDDSSTPETFHKNAFTENTNSLALFFEVNGKSVFLGGDMTDCESVNPTADFMTRKIARAINKPVYLYKAPHHGTDHTSGKETLEIFRPQIAVITNGDEWLRNYNTIEALKTANPDVQILTTEKQDVVVEL